MKIETVSDIPKTETDEFEFKSSKLPETKVKAKLSAAASAFSNSGGGYFVLGVNDDGAIDGGWPKTVGRQSVEDWIDQIIHSVQPAPNYKIYILEDADGRGTLDSGHGVIIVEFFATNMAPHMAPDRKYYIRAGAHTEAARSFIVEALWSKRAVTTPQLTHLVRLKQGQPKVLQLGIVSINSEPAVNVSIDVTGLKDRQVQERKLFPLNINLIDKLNPFFFDVTSSDHILEDVSESARVVVEFSDVSGNKYSYDAQIDILKSIGPFSITVTGPDRLVDAVKQVAKEIKDK